MKTSFPPHQAKGFTLVEVLIVMAIIAILASITIGSFQYVREKQKFSTTEIQIKLLERAIEEYKLDFGNYPDPSGASSPSNALYTALYYDGASLTPPGKIYLPELDPENDRQRWTDGTGLAVTIKDPWGSEYIYRISTDPLAQNPDFDLISSGPDMDEATTGDNIDNF